MRQDLKATADVKWLEKAFQLPYRYWKTHHADFPLLQEMQQAIESGKVRKGGGSRLPRRPDAVVAILIRDKVIFIQNKTSGLALVSKLGEEVETFQWFLEEIEKDLTKLMDPQDTQPNAASSSTGPSGQKQKRHVLDVEEKDIVEASMKKLREHPLCIGAIFLPYRGSLRVTRKDKTTSEIFLSGCKKKRMAAREKQDEEGWEYLRSSFDQTLVSAVEFLEQAGSDPVCDDSHGRS